ncbi:MAG: rRNA pseudouridine synthase [Bacilli bacterium]|nr:rRNA pseudouridine synthase [Bacilli bacterium]
MERVQKVISNLGYASRREAEKLILEGKILINDNVAKLGDKVGNQDIIKINGEILDKTMSNDKVYFLLNKPRETVSTVKDPEGRKTIVSLINTDKRIYPVGRLDYDTTGAIILTNDGELTNLLMHPKNNIEKVYLAKIKGKIGGDAIYNLKKGVIIDDKKTSPARVKIREYNKKNNTSLVEIIIHEGRNHQVKKMFQSVGYDCLKLSRIRFAFLDIQNLNSGEYRTLTIKEVKKLYSLGDK